MDPRISLDDANTPSSDQQMAIDMANETASPEEDKKEPPNRKEQLQNMADYFRSSMGLPIHAKDEDILDYVHNSDPKAYNQVANEVLGPVPITIPSLIQKGLGKVSDAIGMTDELKGIGDVLDVPNKIGKGIDDVANQIPGLSQVNSALGAFKGMVSDSGASMADQNDSQKFPLPLVSEMSRGAGQMTPGSIGDLAVLFGPDLAKEGLAKYGPSIKSAYAEKMANIIGETPSNLHDYLDNRNLANDMGQKLSNGRPAYSQVYDAATKGLPNAIEHESAMVPGVEPTPTAIGKRAENTIARLTNPDAFNMDPTDLSKDAARIKIKQANVENTVAAMEARGVRLQQNVASLEEARAKFNVQEHELISRAQKAANAGNGELAHDLHMQIAETRNKFAAVDDTIAAEREKLATHRENLQAKRDEIDTLKEQLKAKGSNNLALADQKSPPTDADLNAALDHFNGVIDKSSNWQEIERAKNIKETILNTLTDRGMGGVAFASGARDLGKTGAKMNKFFPNIPEGASSTDKGLNYLLRAAAPLALEHYAGWKSAAAAALIQSPFVNSRLVIPAAEGAAGAIRGMPFGSGQAAYLAKKRKGPFGE